VAPYDVAVYAPWASPLFTGDRTRSSGGAELQTWFLSRALADRGLRVAHVVLDMPGLPGRSDGIELVTQPEDVWSYSLPQNVRAITASLRRADARVYIQRSAAFDTGVIAAFARARGRRFVFSSSSSTDLSARPTLPTRAGLLSFRAGVRMAHEVVVQTDDQRRQAAERMRRTPTLIRSFCSSALPSAAARSAFLWVGRLIDYKRPLAYTELAQALPEARFLMAIGDEQTADAELLATVRDAATRLPNLELLPPLARDDLLALYGTAVAVVNTSSFEGFPNTFMEGWARGTPALSLDVDPDRVISARGLGAVAGGSVERLTEAARELWESRSSPSAVGERARRYIAETHDPAVVGDQWAKLVQRA
jgi:glycosyltransferase involved in cell wall biosynthesis